MSQRAASHNISASKPSHQSSRSGNDVGVNVDVGSPAQVTPTSRTRVDIVATRLAYTSGVGQTSYVQSQSEVPPTAANPPTPHYLLSRFFTVDVLNEPLRAEASIAVQEGRIRNGENMLVRRMMQQWELEFLAMGTDGLSSDPDSE